MCKTRQIGHILDHIAKLVLTKEARQSILAYLWCAWDLNTVVSGRSGFAVRPTAKYVGESSNLVQLQNAKPVATPLTEQNIQNYTTKQPLATKSSTH